MSTQPVAARAQLHIRRPVLRYYGGKWRLAPRIIQLFPPHHVYVEAFGGAASVLMLKPRSDAEIYNDLDGEVVNVFRILQVEARARKLETLLRASRGCTEKCSFCIVPFMNPEGLTLLPNFTPRPVLCDNNLSALPAEYQDYIIEKYVKQGIRLKDANSGFEPKTFNEEVYVRWRPLLNTGGGPWRFGYDHFG